jgi:hypothetical protein
MSPRRRLPQEIEMPSGLSPGLALMKASSTSSGVTVEGFESAASRARSLPSARGGPYQISRESLPLPRVNQGLATLTRAQVVAGGKVIEVGKVRITDAGRRAIEGPAE